MAENHVDLEDELSTITLQAPEGENARHGKFRSQTDRMPGVFITFAYTVYVPRSSLQFRSLNVCVQVLLYPLYLTSRGGCALCDHAQVSATWAIQSGRYCFDV